MAEGDQYKAPQEKVEMEATPNVQFQPTPGMAPGPQMNPAMAGALAAIPPGLEFLTTLKDVYVQQIFDAFEVVTGWERNNKYSICTENEQEFMKAKEETDCCTRQMLGQMRPFTIHLSLLDGREVIQLTRPLRCQGALCCCCLQELTITCPPGVIVGYVKEKHTCCYPEYVVEDASNTAIFDIKGEHMCKLGLCCTDIVFKILSCVDGSEVGQIVKRWRGCHECLGYNRFSLHVPLDLDVRMKTILLGATFLVDFMYFERNNSNN